MYNWRPVFKCELCDKEAVAVKDPWGHWIVPSKEGWSGSFKKRGRCLCDTCTKAFNQLKNTKECF